MYIQKLRLENFRKFEDVMLHFHPQFNILIGENASGKTAICDAIKKLLHNVVLRLGGAELVSDKFSGDIRYSFSDGRSIEYHCPSQLTVNIEDFFGNPVTWTLRKELTTDSYEYVPNIDKEIRNIKIELQNKLVQKDGYKETIFPLISYYNIPRVQKQRKNKFKNILESRFNAYKTSLVGNCDPRPFFNWLYRQFLIDIQTQQKNPLLDAVRQAIQKAVPVYRNIGYNPLVDEVMVLIEDETFSFNSLSDGYRDMIGVVADIAHRMARLNPQLDDQVLTETPGVVVIDEIDLHLHPNWQRTIVENLRSIFPKVQFIATTHSPFIIQSARDGEVIDLNGVGSILQYEGEYQNVAFPGTAQRYDNKGVEEIAEEIQKVDMPHQSQRRKEMYKAAQEYYKILDEISNASEEEKRKKEEKLSELTKPFMDNAAYVAFLDRKLLLLNK
jgi:predicted ATP-binding protein involved in virulence